MMNKLELHVFLLVPMSLCLLMSAFDLPYLNKGNVRACKCTKIPIFMQIDEVEDQHKYPKEEMTNNKMMVTITK